MVICLSYIVPSPPPFWCFTKEKRASQLRQTHGISSLYNQTKCKIHLFSHLHYILFCIDLSTINALTYNETNTKIQQTTYGMDVIRCTIFRKLIFVTAADRTLVPWPPTLEERISCLLAVRRAKRRVTQKGVSFEPVATRTRVAWPSQAGHRLQGLWKAVPSWWRKLRGIAPPTKSLRYKMTVSVAGCLLLVLPNLG